MAGDMMDRRIEMGNRELSVLVAYAKMHSTCRVDAYTRDVDITPDVQNVAQEWYGHGEAPEWVGNALHYQGGPDGWRLSRWECPNYVVFTFRSGSFGVCDVQTPSDLTLEEWSKN